MEMHGFGVHGTCCMKNGDPGVASDLVPLRLARSVYRSELTMFYPHSLAIGATLHKNPTQKESLSQHFTVGSAHFWSVYFLS